MDRASSEEKYGLHFRVYGFGGDRKDVEGMLEDD